MSPSVWRPLSKPRQPVSRETLYCWENPKCHSSICARSPASLPPYVFPPPHSAPDLIPLLSSPYALPLTQPICFFMLVHIFPNHSLLSAFWWRSFSWLSPCLFFPKVPEPLFYHSFTFLPQPTPLPSKPVLPRLLCPSKLHSYVWIDINVLQFQTEIYVLYFLGFFCHCCLGTMGWKCKKEKSPGDQITTTVVWRHFWL